MELPELKKALADRAEDVCRHLLPGGKRDGGEWKCGDLSGTAGGSLGIVLGGEKAGVWRDFAGGIGGSNLLELWVQARNIPFKTALDEAKGWLGKAGVAIGSELQQLRKKTYAKPTTKGIVQILSRTEFYLRNTRQIPKEILDLYKISSLDTDDVIVFPYLAADAPHKAEMIKYVKIDRDENGKKVSWTSKDTAKVLFGKSTRRPEDRYLLISEGEIDAMTWRARKLAGLCCTSVPFGAKWEGKDGKDPNSEWIENDWDFIHSFERIYISADMDDEGRKMQAALVKRLGREVCFCIELPTKDANELQTSGREAELDKAFQAARTLDPAVLKNASVFKQAVLDRLYGENAVKRGIPLPFGNYPFHLRWNEWTVVTGMNGSGKTTILNYILLYLAKMGGYKSTVASLEVLTEQTLSFYVPQCTGVKLPPKAQAEFSLDWVAQFFWFYDLQGKADLKDILEAFSYAYRRYGVRFFVIDSWMRLGIDPENLTEQGEACRMLSDFTRDHDVHLFVVAHPRKLKDEHQKAGKMDIKGSGQLTDEAHNVWVVRRNKAKERELEKCRKLKDDDAIIAGKRRGKPDAELAVEKQRNDDGDEPLIDLWFVKEAKQYFGHFRDTGISLITEAMPTEAPASAQPDQEIDKDVPF
jgi:twinkle protein